MINIKHTTNLISDLYAAGMNETAEDMQTLLSEIKRLVKRDQEQVQAFQRVYELVKDEESAKSAVIRATIENIISKDRL